MAIEEQRGCGYRKVGALYMVGGYAEMNCDRLPMPLHTCPVCGGGVKLSRGFTEVNPLRLFGNHDDQPNIASIAGEVTGHGSVATCKDEIRPCHVCDPPDAMAYIMTVGQRHYSVQTFTEEAKRLGVSKRIAAIPRNLKLGETIVYLAHPEACRVKEPVALQHSMNVQDIQEANQHRLLDVEKVKKAPGLFCAFIPQKIEMPVWESQLKGKKGKTFKDSLKKRGITPVPVPDGDKDHK